MVDVKIEESWKNRLSEEFGKDYFGRLIDFVKNEYKTRQIYPPGKFIFNAFDKAPFDKVKVVILESAKQKKKEEKEEEEKKKKEEKELKEKELQAKKEAEEKEKSPVE